LFYHLVHKDQAYKGLYIFTPDIQRWNHRYIYLTSTTFGPDVECIIPGSEIPSCDSSLL